MKSAVSGIIITGALLPTLALAKGSSKATGPPHCVNSCMVDATRKRDCVPYYEKCFCGKEYEDFFKACAEKECAKKELDEAINAGFGRCNATVGVTCSTSMTSETSGTAAPATVTPSIPHHVPCKVKHPVVVVTKTVTTPLSSSNPSTSSSSSAPSSPPTAPDSPSIPTTADTSETTVPTGASSTSAPSKAATATDSGAEMAYVGSLGLLSIATLLFLL